MKKFNLRLGTYYRYQLLNKFGLFKHIKKTHKILDVGGFDGYILSRLNCKHKTLIDINIKKKFGGINYIKNDFLEQRFNRNSFNYIFPFDVLEHISTGKEKQFVLKIIGMLKKGGSAYITVPSRNIKVFPSFLTSWVSKRWGHFKCLGFSVKKLTEFLVNRQIDYELIELNTRGYLNLYLLIKLIQKLIPKDVIKYILNKLAEYDYYHHAGTSGYLLVKIKKL